jgi:hypothetical protein
MELRECRFSAFVYLTASLVHYFDIADSTGINMRFGYGYTEVEAKLNTLFSSTIEGSDQF